MFRIRLKEGRIFILKTFPALLLFVLFSYVTPARSEIISNNEVQSVPTLKDGIYLIVGVFQVEYNAQKYLGRIKSQGVSASLGRRASNSMLYVYTYYTPDDIETARRKRTEHRASSRFHDAWLLYIGIDIDDLGPQQEYRPAQQYISQKPTELILEDVTEPEPEEEIPVPEDIQPPDGETYKYQFNVVSSTTYKEVPGYVQIIDADRSKAMQSVSTNTLHYLEAPSTVSKRVIALCDIFGYVKQQVDFVIDDPMSSQYSNQFHREGDVTVVTFELLRHKVGDILTMYQVYFYNDAAIMKPESKFELNSLLDMLKENENLEITIHGHTNGNAPGKIIKLAKGDTRFFEVSDDNIESQGSAKELSEQRAEVIRNWLISQGISAKRMKLEGWGGKKMLYDKNDPMAARNIRVEIEIMKE